MKGTKNSRKRYLFFSGIPIRVLKKQIQLFLVSAGLVSIFGCGTQKQPDYIEYWCASNTFEVEFARKIVDMWNADSSHRRVRLQPVPEGQSSEEVMLAAIVGKTTPDIYSNAWPGIIEQYRNADILVNFDQFNDFAEVLRGRVPEKLFHQFISPDGKYYQFPWKGNPLMMAYNQDLLVDWLGCDLPETYNDFFIISEKLKEKLQLTDRPSVWILDPNIMPIWWQRFFDFYPFYVAATQGRTFIDRNKEVQLDSPEGRLVFDFFRRGYESGLMPISIFKEDIFLQNRLLFHITGPWSIAHYERFASDNFRWGYTPIPVPKPGMIPYTYGDAKNIIIFKSSRFREDCWEFIKFMTSRKNDLIFLETTQQLPLRKDILRDKEFADFFNQHPQMRIFAEQIPNIVGVDQSLYMQEIFDMISKSWDALVVYGVEDIERGLLKLDRQVQVQVDREK
ncbi:MAG: extracellular solute-binding protein [FCB group bacterium]|nr:extracellular solute-binding protein [FCB group bacterium]